MAVGAREEEEEEEEAAAGRRRLGVVEAVSPAG